jgi:hypothetical protein
MMDEIIDNATFGICRSCGDEISLQNVTRDQIREKARKVDANGGRCDRCEEGSTAFAKQARFQILQWLGPIEYRKQVASVIEPQNASYTVVMLRDGRSAKIFRRGESSRELPEEIDHVFTHSFPDLKRIEKP